SEPARAPEAASRGTRRLRNRRLGPSARCRRVVAPRCPPAPADTAPAPEHSNRRGAGRVAPPALWPGYVPTVPVSLVRALKDGACLARRSPRSVARTRSRRWRTPKPAPYQARTSRAPERCRPRPSDLGEAPETARAPRGSSRIRPPPNRRDAGTANAPPGGLRLPPRLPARPPRWLA